MLNGSDVTPKERTQAERYYLSKFAQVGMLASVCPSQSHAAPGARVLLWRHSKTACICTEPPEIRGACAHAW